MNTTTEKRLQVTLDGPDGCGKTVIGAAIIYALTQRGAQVSFQDADGPAPQRRARTGDLNGFVVDILTAGAPGMPLTVADRYADATDAELAEAVRAACTALNTAIKAAEDAGLTVGIDVGSEVEICELSRPL